VLLQARDSSGNAQPITAAPVATLNPRYPQLAGTMVFVGTGQLLGIPDLSNVRTQTVYGVYDPPAAYSSPLTRASLVQQTLTAATLGGLAVAVESSNTVSLPATKGWFVDLTLNSGERVVNTPLLRSGALIVTSTQPSVSSCTPGGVSYSYYINYATGSAFTSPQFDVNGDGVINQSDMVLNANGTRSVVVGVKLGTGFYADATLENSSSGTGAANAPGYLVYTCPATGAGVCIPRYMKGAISHRISWWEVRQ